MTVAVAMPELATMTPADARALTDAVRDDLAALWARVWDLYTGGAHRALGYRSWGDYWAGEFGQSPSRGDQIRNAGRVAHALAERGLPMPPNDHTARELLPVLRQAPDDLPDVWGRAVDAAGERAPTGREVRALVAPYVETDVHRGKPRGTGAHASGPQRRLRNMVARPVISAEVSARTAAESLGGALETEPDTGMAREWLEHVEQARRHLASVSRRLKAYVGEP